LAWKVMPATAVGWIVENELLCVTAVPLLSVAETATV
jgi:hypothetical protein